MVIEFFINDLSNFYKISLIFLTKQKIYIIDSKLTHRWVEIAYSTLHCIQIKGSC